MKKTKALSPSQRLDTLLQATNLEGSVIARTFRRMGIAEEEIAAAKKAHPEYAERFHNGFMDLMPPRVLYDFPDELYRAFCREKLQFMVSRPSVTTTTHAEAAAKLSNTSIRAPLAREYEVAYYLALKKCLPEAAKRAIPNETEAFTELDLKDGANTLAEVRYIMGRAHGASMEWQTRLSNQALAKEKAKERRRRA